MSKLEAVFYLSAIFVLGSAYVWWVRWMLREADAMKARAEELESRLKSCASCKHNFGEWPECEECKAEGCPGNHYPRWKLAPKERL